MTYKPILALDPSLSSTGVCYYVESYPRRTRAITTSPNPDLTPEENRLLPQRIKRYERIFKEILRFWSKSKCKAQTQPVVLIEGYAFSAKGNSTLDLAELGGYLRCLLQRHFGLIPIEVAPGQLKKFTTGNGNAKKPEMAEAIESMYGETFDTNDEVDAYALCHLGHYLVNVPSEEWTEYDDHELKVLTDLKEKYCV